MASNRVSQQVFSREKIALIHGIDLFCGAGGLTYGLEAAGINVRIGVDIDLACKYPYITNNNANFLLKSVEDISATDLSKAFDGNCIKLLAGCAPCQSFSAVNSARLIKSDKRSNLLSHFGRLIKEIKPHLVAMENVPLIRHDRVFQHFLNVLMQEQFNSSWLIVDCANYGVPQYRQRLILLASRLGKIWAPLPTTPKENHATVRDAIGNLPYLNHGEVNEEDPLHQTSLLTSINLERIRASRPGGTWRDWPEDLRSPCHCKASGKNYSSVYGRLAWDRPSSTITTKCFNYGSGRFGHPEQDRVISLRESAILQSFPSNYKFSPPEERIKNTVVARMIGNSVPPILAKAIGETIKRHVSQMTARGSLNGKDHDQSERGCFKAM